MTPRKLNPARPISASFCVSPRLSASPSLRLRLCVSLRLSTPLRLPAPPFSRFQSETPPRCRTCTSNLRLPKGIFSPRARGLTRGFTRGLGRGGGRRHRAVLRRCVRLARLDRARCWPLPRSRRHVADTRAVRRPFAAPIACRAVGEAPAVCLGAASASGVRIGAARAGPRAGLDQASSKASTAQRSPYPSSATSGFLSSSTSITRKASAFLIFGLHKCPVKNHRHLARGANSESFPP
jgi:hypothetical protein